MFADPHLIATALFPVLLVFTGIVAYIFFIRPTLRQTPVFRDLYDAEAGFWSATSVKLTGLKQRLTTIGISAAGFIVLAHDEITTLLTAAGVDPASLPAQVLPKVPVWVWPVVTMGAIWLVQRFRNAADRAARANAEALLNAGQPLAAAAPGLTITTQPSPSPLASLPDKVG